MYSLLAAAVVALHLAFIGYAVLGGFLAWRWPRTLTLHLAVASYAALITAIGWDCPLTGLERSARRHAGQTPYPEGFIDHYLTGVVYPENAKVLARAIAALVVLASYLGLWWIRRRSTRGTIGPSADRP